MQIKKITLIIGFVLLVISCSQKHEYRQLTGFTQGTTYSIAYEDINSKDYTPQIDSIYQVINQTFSTYDSLSMTSKINNNEPNIVLNNMFCDAFDKSLKIWKVSGGAFDITVGGLVNAWGFGKKQGKLPDSTFIDSLKAISGFEKVSIVNNRLIKKDNRICIDMNGIAQGYTVDRVAMFFESEGIENYLVEIGGEVRVHGYNSKGKRWRIGVDKPEDNNSEPGTDLQTILVLKDQAISTSGNYRKFYIENGVKYSHTIDPKTGYPARSQLLSASVITDECAKADAYATTFMVMGLDKTIEFVKKNNELEVYLIYSDDNGAFKVYKTEGIKEFEK